MSRNITRRAFIIESGTGLAYTLVSALFARQALDWWENERKPLLIPPANPKRSLIAQNEADGYVLYLHEIPQRIPTITWAEYLENYALVDPANPRAVNRELRRRGYALGEIRLDEECPEDLYADSWCLNFSPNALAYDYLQDLKLGQRTTCGTWEPIGGLSFQDCPSIGSTFRGVLAEDELSLCALQERLKQLGEDTRIVIS